MNLKKVVFLISLVCALAVLGAAQITQTGNLNGTVADAEKAMLPGVAVSITSPALILPEMSAVTNAQGFFRFPALPPGLYTVTFELPGFSKLVRQQIRVTVGTTTTLDVTLEQTRVEESVTVVGQSPTVDTQRTTLVVNLTSEFLQSVPATRNIDAYFNMVPGVSGDSTHGSADRDNTYNLDGVNVTDPVTGTRAGSFSVDVMEELSAQTAGLPAEYGSVRGGVVNVVTKSGGNTFSGSLSAYFRNKDLQWDNTVGTVFEGSFAGFDYEVEPGLNFGGPILKDKIWFFGNLSFNKVSQFVNGYPYDTQPTNAPTDEFRPYPYLKLTFQASANDKITLSYNYSNFIRHHRGAGVTQTVDTTWNQGTPTHTLNLQWARFFNSNFLMNFKTILFMYQLNLTAKNDLPNIYDSTLRRNSQSYGYDDEYSRNRWQGVTDATYFLDDWMGRHEIKAGIEFEYSWDVRNWTSKLDPVTGLGPFFYTRNGVPDYVIIYPASFARKDRKFVVGGFLQDTWNPIARLTLNVGFRFDHQEGIIPKQGEERDKVTYKDVLYDPQVYETMKPLTWNTLSPRLGAIYDLSGDGKTVLKVSFGRYYVANIMQWFVWVNPNAFINYRYRLNSDYTARGDMYSFSAQAGSRMDPDLSSPYLDEFTFGLEREILRDLRLGVRYIRKWDRNLIESVDTNAMDYDALRSGADIFSVWTNYTPVTAVDPYDGSTATFWYVTDATVPAMNYYTNPPGAKRDYDGVEITLDKRFSQGWQISASYVYQDSRGIVDTEFNSSHGGTTLYNNPNAHINAVGDFSLERKHQFKLNGMVQGPWGVTFSFYYRYLSGNPWTRQIRAYDLGLNPPQGNVTIFAEARGSRLYPALNLLDIRLEKTFKLPGKLGRMGIFADMFNVFNINSMTTANTVSSAPPQVVNTRNVNFGEATAIYATPRIVRLGVKFEF